MLAREKQMRMGTGGGPFKKNTPVPEDATALESLIDSATNVEIEGALDSDTLMLLNHGKIKASLTHYF